MVMVTNYLWLFMVITTGDHQLFMVIIGGLKPPVIVDHR
jgi:hypothetical protein